MSEPIVVIMVKAPRAGEVKTRLVPPLSEADAASLAVCMLTDTVSLAQEALNNVAVAYAPANGRKDLESILPSNLLWLEQQGHDLGERLVSAANHVFSLGFSPLIILGADSPTLPIAFIEEALRVLTTDRADLILGPTNDGGYYLVGVQRPIPGPFQNIDWSTAFVYEQTAANASALKLRLRSLPDWYDVDTPVDLERLRRQILSDDGMRRRAPKTYDWFVEQASPSS